MAVPAFAWEFSMSGAFHSEYRYLTQLGENGFFGRYDQVAAAAGVAEVPNLYTGVHFLQISGQDMVGGSDASTHAFWAQIDPQIRINKAIRIRGRYRIGDLDSPLGNYDTKQFHSMDGGVLDEFAYGGWTMLWGTAQTPWGTIVLGKRPFAFGNGLMFDGTTTLSTDSILFVAPYGPFRFLIGQQAARSSGVTLNRANKTGVEEWEHTAAMTYSCGPLQLGTFLQYVSIHGGPEGAVLPGTRDTKVFLGDQYLKYANGRFFLNAEIAAHLVDTHWSFQAPTYQEHVRWMVEMGVLAGPVKLSALYANVPGGNNRADKSYQSGLVNATLFVPYSMLMVRNYGSGLVAYSGDIYEGMLQDAAFFGVRIDNAVAANLNVWVAGAYAERINNSQGWGCVAPATGGVMGGRAVFADQGTVDPGDGLFRVVPNTDLGWEVSGGIDWKLMEGLRVLQEVGYYQPGKWFKHAYVDAGVGLAHDAASVNWERSIDPILAYYLTANFEF
jgi:hypothetical protein